MKILSKLLYGLSLFLMFQSYAQDFEEKKVYVKKDALVQLVFSGNINMVIPDDNSLFHLRSADGQKTFPVQSVGQKSVVALKAKKRFEKTYITAYLDGGNRIYEIEVLYSDVLTKRVYPIDYDFSDEQKLKKVYQPKMDPDEVDVDIEKVVVSDEKIHKKQDGFFLDTIQYKGVAKILYTEKDNKNRVVRTFAKRGRLLLHFVASYARKDKLYLKFVIENGNTLPFHIAHWSFHFAKKRSKQIENSPEHEFVPVYEYDREIMSILPREKIVRVFVLDNSTIKPENELVVHLFEKGKDRNTLRLSLDEIYVNRAPEVPDKFLPENYY